MTLFVYNFYLVKDSATKQKQEKFDRDQANSKSFGLNLFRGAFSADQVFPFPEGMLLSYCKQSIKALK